MLFVSIPSIRVAAFGDQLDPASAQRDDGASAGCEWCLGSFGSY